MSFKTLWISKTGDANAWYHIYPFVKASNTEKIHIVRVRPPQRSITDPKLALHTFSAGSGMKEKWKFFRTGYKLLKSQEIDFIISFSLMPWGSLAWLLAKIFKKPILIGLIGSDFNTHVKKGRFSGLFRYILKKTDIITTPGSVMSAEVRQLLGRTDGVYEYPHGLAPDQVVLKSPQERKQTLISISALTGNKRTIDILEALRLLHDRGHTYRLKILGSGSEEQNLRDFVKANGLGELVDFEGYVQDITPYLGEADFFVQASLNEGLSLSLIETMGYGIIPIVTEAGSEKDIISNDINGLFVEKQNPADIASKIEYASKEEVYNRLRSGLETSVEELRIEHAIQRVEELQEILKSH